MCHPHAVDVPFMADAICRAPHDQTYRTCTRKQQSITYLHSKCIWLGSFRWNSSNYCIKLIKFFGSCTQNGTKIITAITTGKAEVSVCRFRDDLCWVYAHILTEIRAGCWSFPLPLAMGKVKWKAIGNASQEDLLQHWPNLCKPFLAL